MNNLVITGIPRSGTSLAAALVDQSQNACCLSEPERHLRLVSEATSAEDFVSRLKSDFESIRIAILSGVPVVDRRGADGIPVTNYFLPPSPDGVRRLTYTNKAIRRLELTSEFTLGVKHNALFSGVLPQLVTSQHFRILILIRDPVEVLLSWRSLDLPISKGRLPLAERFWPEIALLGNKSNLNLIDRQILICDLLYRRFQEWETRTEIVRYERFVKNPSLLLRSAGILGSVPAIPINAATVSRHRALDNDGLLCANRIREMASSRLIPGICHFYPHYSNAELQ